MTPAEIAAVIRQARSVDLTDDRTDALLACARLLCENWQHPYECWNATNRCTCGTSEIAKALKGKG